MKKIRTLVVDDEPLARERLAGPLAHEPGREGGARCRDGEEAGTAIVDHVPDLVFLDVQMPQMNGFEVIEAVGGERMPLGIFVTPARTHPLPRLQDPPPRVGAAPLAGRPGPRARLSVEAVRPRTVYRVIAARAQADRTRRERRSR